MLDDKEFLADWETTAYNSDDWENPYQDVHENSSKATTSKKQAAVENSETLKVSEATQQQQQQHLREQEIYLKRLQVAARRLAAKKKKRQRTFAQALKNTTSNNPIQTDEETNFNSSTFEQDDQLLLNTQTDRSHPLSIDVELTTRSTTGTLCDQCRERCKEVSCSVS